MFDLTSNISEPFEDGEDEKEPEVTCDPPSVTGNIDFSISPIKGPHEIVQGNLTKNVTTSQKVVVINEN